MKTIKQSRMEKGKAENRFFAKASKMLVEAKTPEDIQEAYEYILKERKKLTENMWKK